MTKRLFIGGMVAGGFDCTGKYLLVVSHSGRGVFEVGTWQRVARDAARAYPDASVAVGIGPISEERIAVHEIDCGTGVLVFASPDGNWALRYSEGALDVSSAADTLSQHA
jgi:hypothetical protein